MLTLPLIFAVISAGALGGVHCVGMCGGISSMLTGLAGAKSKVIPIYSATITPPGLLRLDRTQILLQAGRLTTYMLVGAVAGSLGAAGMIFKSVLPLHTMLFVIGNLALILLGLRLFGFAPRLSGLWKPRFPALNEIGGRFVQFSQQRPFILGMSWGCLPCGLLYGIFPFAWLSGQAWSGAILMLLFGLSALPHLLLAQQLSRVRSIKQYSRPLAVLAGCLLIGVGLVGLWFGDMKSMPGFLCVTPTA